MSDLHCLVPADAGTLTFSGPLGQEIAHSGRELDALLDTVRSRTAQADSWQVLYLSYEAGLLLLDPQRFADAAASHTGPLAAGWHYRKATPTRPGEQIDVPTADLLHLEWDEPTYLQAFAAVQAAIRAGETYQLNLTMRASAATCGQTPWPLPDHGRGIGHILLPGLKLFSRTPECFLRYDPESRKLETLPIKGTLPPGTPFTTLQHSAKEQAEHAMVVDMCRNDLGRVCEAGSIGVTPYFGPLTLPYATHAESVVSGTLRPDRDLVDALRAMLPAASISGTPKHQACQAIAAIEASPRGPYTGVLGWIAPGGAARFCLLIRTLWQTADGRLHYGTGGGIVADSNGPAEYREAILKTEALSPSPAQQHPHVDQLL